MGSMPSAAQSMKRMGRSSVDITRVALHTVNSGRALCPALERALKAASLVAKRTAKRSALFAGVLMR